MPVTSDDREFDPDPDKGYKVQRIPPDCKREDMRGRQYFWFMNLRFLRISFAIPFRVSSSQTELLSPEDRIPV